MRWVRRGIPAPLGLQDPLESEAYLDRMDPKETQWVTISIVKTVIMILL